jgi:hypothetical protein
MVLIIRARIHFRIKNSLYADFPSIIREFSYELLHINNFLAITVLPCYPMVKVPELNLREKRGPPIFNFFVMPLKQRYYLEIIWQANHF